MKSIRIGTRKSPLALWQAEKVKSMLEALGVDCELCPVQSQGDKNLTVPLYSMGITGVFTKDLDVALLEGSIDIAVHSLKDIPTILPEGLVLGAVLERDYPHDVLVSASSASDVPEAEMKIATSSLRRKAFWSSKYPQTDFADIRGNVQTRLQKLHDGAADATLFSQAAIERMGLDVPYRILDWLLPAPGQGVIGVTARDADAALKNLLRRIECQDTAFCTALERQFLQNLEGGCTAPIGAFAEKTASETYRFRARLSSLDGSQSVTLDEEVQYGCPVSLANQFSEKMLNAAGASIMQGIRDYFNSEK